MMWHVTKKCITLAWLFITVVVALGNETRNADDATSPRAITRRPLKVFLMGYLKTDTEQAQGEEWYQGLRVALLRGDNLRTQLESAGFGDIAVVPAEGFKDMVQRMSHNEFDLAFCSSYVYVEQTGDYRAMLQLRRKRDSFGRGGATQRGVIIVNSRSPFFEDHSEATLKRLLPRYLAQQRMAFVSVYSAPGYVYPRLKLHNDFGISTLQAPIFCDSSEEVVKYVINGLVEIGTCESGAVEEVLQSAGLTVPPDRLVRKILETEPLPTDPIVIRSAYHPQDSELGRELRTALRAYYASAQQEAVPDGRQGVPRLEDSRDKYYQNLEEAIRDFSAIGKKKMEP
jgi:ABC-type phosphate/phosphonate transport system substrate-binding protein